MGAVVCKNYRDVAEGSDVVISMVGYPQDVEQVYRKLRLVLPPLLFLVLRPRRNYGVASSLSAIFPLFSPLACLSLFLQSLVNRGTDFLPGTRAALLKSLCPSGRKRKRRRREYRRRQRAADSLGN